MNNYPYGNDPMRDMDSTIPAAPFNPAQQSPSAPQQIMPPPPVPQPAPQPIAPPQPAMPQPVAQQPYTPAYSAVPVAPAPHSGKGFLKENLLGILVCASGIAGVALSIAGIIESNDVFGYAMHRFTSEQRNAQNLVEGPSPVLGLIMVIFGLLFSAAAVVLGFIFSSKQTEEGSPKSTAFKVGMIFGAVGALLFIFAIFATSCSTCSYCSVAPTT